MSKKQRPPFSFGLFVGVALLGLGGCLFKPPPDGVGRVSPPGFHQNVLGLSWCSNHELVLATESGAEDRPEGRLYLLDTTTHKMKLLVREWGFLHAPDCQPGSRKVVFYSDLDLSSPTGIWILGLDDGSKPEYLTAGDGVAWAPDGTYLAVQRAEYRAVDPVAQELVIYEINTGQTRTVYSEAREGLHVHALAWSPDGLKITFARGVDEELGGPPYRGPDSWSIVSWNLTEGTMETLVPLTPGIHYYDYAWSPDGNHLALSQTESWTGSQLLVREVRDGCSVAPLGNLEVGRLDWSPDGRQIAFSSEGRVYVMEVAKVLGETFFESGLTCP